MATRRKPLAKTVQRGYGAEHKRRVAAERPLQVGKPCVRCGWPMLAGQDIQLDHADDRKSYLGWSHRACNVGASNQRRAAIARARGTAKRRVTATRKTAAARPAPPEVEPQAWVIPHRQHTRDW
jgi:hypothetical protein